MVRLPGHILPALAKATPVPSKPNSGVQPITLTVVLKRDDQAGFERYLRELYDPNSPQFHHFLTQRQISVRFGPSRKDYASVLNYLRLNQFKLVKGSQNRLVMTVRGTRAQVEKAFDVDLQDYRIGKRRFFATDQNPALPAPLAALVQSVSGLSNLGSPVHTTSAERILLDPVSSSPNYDLTSSVCTPNSPPAVFELGDNLFSAIAAAYLNLFGVATVTIPGFGAAACVGLGFAVGVGVATCNAMSYGVSACRRIRLSGAIRTATSFIQLGFLFLVG